VTGAGRRLTITDPGLLLSVQDLGRSGTGAMGVSPSGAVDRFSARAANLLVGNDENDALFESTMTGFAFETHGSMVVAVTGADAELRIAGALRAPWRSHRVPRGVRVEVGPAKRGLRSYLAVDGGIRVDVVLGSRSTDVGAGFGGRLLSAGDELEVGPAPKEAAPRAYPRGSVPSWPDEAVLRAMTAHGLPLLGSDALESLMTSVFTGTPRSTRQALHLSGPRLEEASATDPVTCGMCAGCVQVTREGLPLVLLAEHQTTGGYPVALCVVTADLPRAAQVRPGGRVRFEPVGFAGAVDALVKSERVIRSWRPYPADSPAGDETRLGQGFFEGI
jgi:biotin-dependent carboxylase-like uncharacterized protein